VPRHTKQDVVLGRQRTLFGVDALERQVADLTDLVLRLLKDDDDIDNVHRSRAATWLVTYGDRQASDYELGGNDGKKA